MPPPTETPIIASVLDQDDLEAAVGVDRLPKLLLRSTSEAADTTLFTDRIAEVCQAATDRAAGILYQAFGVDQIRQLFATDYSVWLDVRGIGAGLCGLYQTELVDPETGNYPFKHQYVAAVEDLGRRAKGSPRIVAESTIGANHTINVRTKRIPRRGTFTGKRAF